MIILITQMVTVSHHVPFDFPLYRKELISEDEMIYWKFENHHKVTRIHENGGETTILTYEDPNADFVKDMIRSEKMLFGHDQYSIISEASFDRALQRLIDIIHRC